MLFLLMTVVLFCFVLLFFCIFEGIHSPTSKIQYDNLTLMQWPSHYNYLVYRVPSATLYEQLNVKCS